VAAPAPLTDGLARVEGALLDAVASDDTALTEIAAHLIRAGGKRQRPAFALAAAMTMTPRATPPPHEVVLGAVAVELVHLGSLYHDDVMDEALLRRTVPSVNALWGNHQAILAGDYLLAKASELAASISTEVAGLLAATIARLCEGQLAEARDAFNTDRTEDGYFRSIGGKTAALFSSAARIGAIVGGLDRGQVDAMTEFGLAYGMAFQIVDDVLDLIATEEELGKPAGHDLVEGTYSLPVLRALAAPTGGDLRQMLGGPLDDVGVARALELLRVDDAVTAAVDAAREHTDRAVAALGPAASTEAGGWLVETAQGLLDRVASRA
jgi:heptaprenyl diphosphate synthase